MNKSDIANENEHLNNEIEYQIFLHYCIPLFAFDIAFNVYISVTSC